MTTSELRDMEDAELREHITTARRNLFGLRFQHATGELDNTSGLGIARREIARALTVARERGIYGAVGASTPANEATQIDLDG